MVKDHPDLVLRADDADAKCGAKSRLLVHLRVAFSDDGAPRRPRAACCRREWMTHLRACMSAKAAATASGGLTPLDAAWQPPPRAPSPRGSATANVRARSNIGASLSAGDADPGATAASSLAAALGGVPEEEMLTRIGANAAAYVYEVSRGLEDAVPKAIMTCLVRRAETELLPRMYSAMNSKSVRQCGCHRCCDAMRVAFSVLTNDLCCCVFTRLHADARAVRAG